jgi:citrate synthase
MNQWVNRETVLSRLKIRPQTLYAYVSRHQIAVVPDPQDARKSLYLASDIDMLAVRQTRSRRPSEVAASAIDWGEPVMTSAITTIHRGRLYYRGLDVGVMSETEPFEAVARWLWQVAPLDGRAFTAKTPGSIAAPESLKKVLARLLATDPAVSYSTTLHVGPTSAEALFSLILDHLAPGSTPESIELRLARSWNCPDSADHIRRALILSADHELNPSTFAARLVASTGASLSAAVVAGLCALQGARHGGATQSMIVLVRLARRHGARQALQIWQQQARAGPLPGFGHRLYPEGDFRAQALARSYRSSPLMRDLRRLCEAQTGQSANFDFELAAMCDSVGLGAKRGLDIFAIGRLAGWLAHIQEQQQTGHLIRPRARYQGPAPDARASGLTAQIVLGGRLD